MANYANDSKKKVNSKAKKVSKKKRSNNGGPAINKLVDQGDPNQ